DMAAIVGSDHLYLYDAISPIVLAETIEMSKVFRASRWGRSLRSAGSGGLAGSKAPALHVLPGGSAGFSVPAIRSLPGGSAGFSDPAMRSLPGGSAGFSDPTMRSLPGGSAGFSDPAM